MYYTYLYIHTYTYIHIIYVCVFVHVLVNLFFKLRRIVFENPIFLACDFLSVIEFFLSDL